MKQKPAEGPPIINEPKDLLCHSASKFQENLKIGDLKFKLKLSSHLQESSETWAQI